MDNLEEQGYITLGRNHDLIHSPEQNGCYIQEYKMDGSGRSRTSTIYPNAKDAMLAYTANTAIYGKWS